jgi:hypothetical protein
MPFRCLVLLTALLSPLGFRPAAAEPLSCPQRLAYVDNDPAVRRDAEAMKVVYARIGCPDVVFVGLPGRRGVVAFNNGEVQGEFMRLASVEGEYTRPFLRVPAPIPGVVGRRWARHAAAAGGGGFGYVLGVIWQEQYAAAHGGTGYHSLADLLRAYSAGLIDSFLAEDPAVVVAVREGRLPARPAEAGPTLVSAPLFHYLATEYAAAAAAVAVEVQKRSAANDPPTQ